LIRAAEVKCLFIVYLYPMFLDIMKAKFKTTCSECNAQIKVGEEIAKTPSGKWVHKYCAPQSNELP
jgi:hypothetical protein